MMLRCFSDTLKTALIDATLFSIAGTPLSSSFDIKSGIVYGAWTGLLNRVVQPLALKISDSEHDTSCSGKIVAAIINEYIAEVVLATILTTVTCKPVNIVDAAKVTLIPFVARTIILNRNFGQIVVVADQSTTTRGYGGTLTGWKPKLPTIEELGDIELTEEDEEACGTLTELQTILNASLEYTKQQSAHVGTRPHSIYAI